MPEKDEVIEKFGTYELWRTSDEERRRTGVRIYLMHDGERCGNDWSLLHTVDSDGTPIVRINSGTAR